MSKEYKNIDHLFKDALGQEQVQVPDHVKKQIDRSLFGSRKRWIYFGTLAILSLVSGLIFYSRPGAQIKAEQIVLTENERITESETFETSETSLDTTTTLTASSNKIESAKNIAIKTTKNDHFKDTEQSKTTATIEGKEDNYSKKPNPIMKSIPIESKALSSTNTDSTKNKLLKNKTNRHVNQAQLPDSITELDQQANNSIYPIDSVALQNGNENLQNNQSAAIPLKEKSIPALDDAKVEKDLYQVDSIQIAQNVQPEKEENKNTTVTDTSAVSNDSIASPINIAPIVENKPWLLSLTSGVNFQKSFYKANSSAEQTLYQNALTDKWGYETNLSFAYMLRNGLRFGSGIGYRNSFETFDFDQKVIAYDTTYLTTFVIDKKVNYPPFQLIDSSDFDTTMILSSILTDSVNYIADTLYAAQIDSSQSDRVVGGVNAVSYLTIPIYFGTQMDWNKWKLDLYVAGRMNFLTSASGTYSIDGELVQYAGVKNSIYKRFYMDLTLGAAVHYKLYKDLYLTGTIAYRPVVRTSLVELSFDKKLNYTHFGLGLSYAF